MRYSLLLGEKSVQRTGDRKRLWRNKVRGYRQIQWPFVAETVLSFLAYLHK
jgi:hypothetical protein